MSGGFGVEHAPGQDRFYLLCPGDNAERTAADPVMAATHLDRVCLSALKQLLATEACQVHSKDASYRHLELRQMASFVLFYTSRVICKGRLTMEEKWG